VLLLQRSKDPRDWQALAAQVERRVTDLREGREAMIASTGEALHRSTAGGLWSSTRDFKPLFDLRADERQRVDPDRTADEERQDS